MSETVERRQVRATDEAFVIEVDGRIHDLKRANTFPTLKEMQDAVGGLIERIPLDGYQGLVMLVNEEGIPKQSKLNKRASELAKQPVVGPAIVMAKRLLR